MSTGERQVLNREVIAETALRLIDEKGLSALSMRKLGGELGVEAMSLYHYVQNKDDLLDSVLDLLYAEVDLPTHLPDDQWEQALRLGLNSFTAVLLRHPSAVELFASRSAPSTESLQILLWAYQRFTLVGLAPAEAVQAFRFAVAFVMGHAASELGLVHRLKDTESDRPVANEPEIEEFIEASNAVSSRATFDRGLDTVIAGLRSLYGLT